MHCDREPDSPQYPGKLGISGEQIQPSARSTKPPFGKETAPNAQSTYDCQPYSDLIIMTIMRTGVIAKCTCQPKSNGRRRR
ncbi:hypothetical protein INR49_011208 [Caranx melampygus]|nr:hypothetical protein INR49_011208 [Caranx melampygus]